MVQPDDWQERVLDSVPTPAPPPPAFTPRRPPEAAWSPPAEVTAILARRLAAAATHAQEAAKGWQDAWVRWMFG